jgi:muramoyltetrapeptide carboxypeptidase
VVGTVKKPKRLKIGDTIGVIAPASPVYDVESLLEGVKVMEDLGYNVVLGRSCSLKHGYLSGEDLNRAEDIENFFANKEINAIICLRGGYGSSRILDKINYSIIKNNPKILVGYSDITALHSSFYRKCGLITFHGPMVASDLSEKDDFTICNMMDCLQGNLMEKKFRLTPINYGNFEGKIIGGNLSIVCSLIGTEYEVNLNNKILFLEDVGEEPYSIDRMLHHLKHSGVFKKVKGVILGQFTNCTPQDPLKSLSLEYVLNEFFLKIDIPVYMDFPAGHDKKKITFPHGAKIEVKDNILSFLEEGVC